MKPLMIFIISTVLFYQINRGQLPDQKPEIFIHVSNCLINEDFTIKAIAVTDVRDEHQDPTTEYYLEPYVDFPYESAASLGFDFAIATGYTKTSSKVLGYAKYRFEIYSSVDNEINPFFTYYIDFRTCMEAFLDLQIVIDKTAANDFDIYCRRANQESSAPLLEGQELNYWELANIPFTQECYYKEIIAHNYIENEQDYGVMFIDDVSYESGVDIFTALKGETHNFKSYSKAVTDASVTEKTDI